MDAYEEKTNKDESLKNASLILMMSKSKFGFLIDHEKMIQETIAYIEIVHKVRILGAHFYYMLDP